MKHTLVIQWKDLDLIKNNKVWNTQTETFLSKSLDKAKALLSKRNKSKILFAKFFNGAGESTTLIGS